MPTLSPEVVTSRSPRLHVVGDLAGSASLPLNEAQVHYLRNVMRLGPGAGVQVFNGRDGEWLATISALDRRKGMLECVRMTRAQTPAPTLRYCFAPLKHARLDYMVQKATELGAGSLEPVITSRTVAGRLNPRRMASNAVEAAEQCNLLSVPAVLPAVSLGRLLDDWPPSTALVFCDEDAAAGSPLEALARVPRARIGVLVGPEGGFSPEERALLRRREFVVPISLGPRTMRADTAAVAALAVVQASIGDW